MRSPLKSAGLAFVGMVTAFGLAAYQDNKPAVQDHEHKGWLQSKGCKPAEVTSSESGVPGIPYCPDQK